MEKANGNPIEPQNDDHIICLPNKRPVPVNEVDGTFFKAQKANSVHARVNKTEKWRMKVKGEENKKQPVAKAGRNRLGRTPAASKLKSCKCKKMAPERPAGLQAAAEHTSDQHG